MWIRCLQHIVSQQVKVNIYECTSKTHVLSCLPLLSRVRSICSSSSCLTVANTPQIKNPSSSIVISYLINSGGLSENEAISVSKKINFETTSKPDSVISLLESYGFTKPYISKLITKKPSILSSDPEISLKPKFDFFISKGLSGIELAKFISSDPRVLRECITTQIIPVFDKLRNIVRCDESVVTILKRYPWILPNKQDIKKMMGNIELLRDEGVPQSNISKFLINLPRSFMICTGRFKEIVEEIKGMGFDPYKYTYLQAIKAFTALSKSNRESRMDVYRRFGWSEEQIHNAFRTRPQCMIISEKKITSVMNYLVNEMGYSYSSIAQYATIFCYSSEKRIIPRCSVYKILTSKGLVKNQITLSALLITSEKSFSMKFVKEYAQEVPELLKVYQGQYNSQNLLISSSSKRLSDGVL